MADKKSTSLYFENLGGVNLKASEYTLGKGQFLDLRNVDFDVPNSLQKRPGQTQVVSVATSGPVTSLFEFKKLTGESYVMAGTDTAMFYLASNAYTLLSAGFNNGQPADMLTFLNKLWIANGQTLVSWDGTNATDTPFCPCRTLPLATRVGTAGVYWGISMAYMMGWFFYAYLKKDGSITPSNPFSATPMHSVGAEDTPSYIVLQGFTTPPASGIGYSGINIYAYVQGGTTPFFGRDSLGTAAAQKLFPEYVPLFRQVASATLGAVTFSLPGNVKNWTSMYLSADGFSGSPFCFGNSFAPKYIDVNQNVMFMSGFSNAPSDMWFTEIGQMAVQADYQFEVRTNDGDRVMGHKTYNNNTIVFKEESFHKVIGSTPEDFQLVELSTEFGALSNSAIIEYNEKLLFLDRKGIVQYDGAGWRIISDQIDDIFRQMNLAAAKEKAVAVHHNYRNQVWFGIPVNGSTENNLTVVYDYLVNAWTFFDGFNASSFSFIKGSLPKPTAWRGSPSGMIYQFSESFLGDNGQGISCVPFTRFEQFQGQNSTNVWRRLFLDVGAVSGGVTGVINGAIFTDYDKTTVRATFAMYQSVFQSKAEIGVVGKAVAVQFSHYSASLPFLLNGYTWQKRNLRNV